MAKGNEKRLFSAWTLFNRACESTKGAIFDLADGCKLPYRKENRARRLVFHCLDRRKWKIHETEVCVFVRHRNGGSLTRESLCIPMKRERENRWTDSFGYFRFICTQRWSISRITGIIFLPIYLLTI